MNRVYQTEGHLLPRAEIESPRNRPHSEIFLLHSWDLKPMGKGTALTGCQRSPCVGTMGKFTGNLPSGTGWNSVLEGSGESCWGSVSCEAMLPICLRVVMGTPGLPAAIFVLPETGFGEALHPAGGCPASASDPGSKALYSYSVSLAPSMDKVWHCVIYSGKYLRGPDPFSQSKQKRKNLEIRGYLWCIHREANSWLKSMLGLSKSDCLNLMQSIGLIISSHDINAPMPPGDSKVKSHFKSLCQLDLL